MKYLTILFLLFTLNSFGQNKFVYDCNAKPITVVGGFGGSVQNTVSGQPPTLLQQVKIGLWQNNKPSGFTLFVGFGDVLSKDINVTKIPFAPKPDTYTTGESAFAELGWKIRVNDWFLLNGYAGTNNVRQYLGATALFQINKAVLIGVDYKKSSPGLVLYFSLSK